MKTTFETKNMSTETETFNNAVDLFFGMHPAKRFWILIVLYLVKKRQLHIINNYEGHGLVLAHVSADLIGNETTASEWKDKGIHTRSIVADVDDNQRRIIEEINYGADVDAILQLKETHSEGSSFWGEKQWEPIYLIEVAEALLSLSDEWFHENASWAYRHILAKAQRSAGGNSGEFYQPNEITSLVASLLDVEEGGSVYNPYAGVCSYGVAIDAKAKYVGQEISACYVVGLLNMLLNGKDDAVVEQSDSVSDWLADRQSFDYIVATPPFNAPCNSPYNTTDLDFLIRSAECCKRKAIGVYPTPLTFNRYHKLDNLVSQDLIESVILLPEGLFSSSTIPSVVIVVNRLKPMKGHIRFVDASEYNKKDGRLTILDRNEVLELCKSCQNIPRKVAIKSNEEIIENECILFPKQYTISIEIEVPEGMKCVRLGDILSSIPSLKTSETEGRFFTATQRGSTYVNTVIRASDLEIRSFEKNKVRCVNADCLLVNTALRFFAAYLLTEGEKVYTHSIFHLYAVDDKKALPSYLIGEMSKEYFTSQLSRFSADSYFSRLTVKNFLDLKVILPSLDVQQELLLDSKETMLKEFIHMKELEYQKKLDAFVHNQRQRKHSVLQVLNDLLPAVANVEDFILNNAQVGKDSVVSRRKGTTLQQYLSSIHATVDKITWMVEDFTSEETYGAPEEINVETFLEKYCTSKEKLGDYKVLLIQNHGDGEGIKPFVKIAPKDLTQMLDNLFSNAIKYGFRQDEEKKKLYTIRIEVPPVHSYDTPVQIKVANDGIPVSKCIAIDKLFTWGVGNGSGIGCWQVKDIAEHFGGNVEFKEYPNDPDGFVSEFSICLPLYEN